MNRPLLRLGFLVLVATALGATACGGSNSQSGGTGGAPETNNGEAQSVSYEDTRYQYRIDAPGRIAIASDGSAGFVGPTERIQIIVKVGSSTADLTGQARSDIASLSSSLTAFQLQSGPSPITIDGRKAEKFVFTFSAGTSAVTGKPLNLVGVRYYVPKDASTLAIVTYGIATDQYDPQGADDIASTFKWL